MDKPKRTSAGSDGKGKKRQSSIATPATDAKPKKKSVGAASNAPAEPEDKRKQSIPTNNRKSGEKGARRPSERDDANSRLSDFTTSRRNTNKSASVYETDQTELELGQDEMLGVTEEEAGYEPDISGESEGEARGRGRAEARGRGRAEATERSKMLKEMWDRISAEITSSTFDSPSRVFKLRKYHSEPDLALPFEKKFLVNIDLFEESFPEGQDPLFLQERGLVRAREKYLSLEDIPFLVAKEHPELMRGEPADPKLREKAAAITDKLKCTLMELVQTERKRYSFYDELFAMGYVVDSLEVPAPPPKRSIGRSLGNTAPVQPGDYFVEAEEKHYRKKVDYGRVVFKTKHVYTGNFQDWYFEGPGRYSWEDGTVYQGEFSRGVMNGPGSIQWPDGCIYEGTFIDGIRTGWGAYSSEDGQTYAGEWLGGLPHGHGKMYYDPDDDDNDYYEGQWEKGLHQGVGTRQYATGDRYVGNWSQGLRNGYGIMIWLRERQVYKGEWKDGLPNGFGKHIWYLERSASNSFPTRHIYQGAWSMGMREGIGRMIYPCGSVYEGCWKNGQRHGKGMFINPAGNILVGLFRAGAIIGGSEVPLHAPSYECDFGGLTEWLTAKFSLVLEEDSQQEQALAAFTKQYLPYIRKLYHRAGEFSQRYGNHGLYPSYMKKAQADGGKQAIHRDFIRTAEPAHMKGKAEKPASIDGINPVTRFGLWLLIRDCEGLLDEVTMAFYDKIWCETAPLSFQTKHNPFEPVYLWQFVQALVAVAVAYFVDIPRRPPHARVKVCVDLDELTPTGRPKDDAASKEEQRSKTNKRRGRQSGKSSIAFPENENISKRLSRKAKRSKKRPDEDGTEQKRRSSIKRKRGKSRDDGGAQEEETSGEDGVGEEEAETPVDVEELPSYLEYDGEDGIFPGRDARASSFASGSQKNDSPEEVDTTPPPPEKTISEAFELLLVTRLIPCLKRNPGVNLPLVPQPLPALVDMYDAFKAIKDRGIINGSEFVRAIIPHPLFPNRDAILWWHRSPEPLSVNVDLEEMLQVYRGKFPEGEVETVGKDYDDDGHSHLTALHGSMDVQLSEEGSEEGSGSKHGEGNEENQTEKGGGDYLGVQPDTSAAVLHLLNIAGAKTEDEEEGEGADDDDCEPESNVIEVGHNLDQARKTLFGDLLKFTGSDTSLEEFLADGNLFGEGELAPEPFLLADDYKCIPTARKFTHLQNVTKLDVLKTIRQLYPKLCMRSGEEADTFNFDLIFCDWLWCVSLLAKASTDKEFTGIAPWQDKGEKRILTNPQSQGVYAHYFRQIKNNPYLSPTPPPNFKPKLRRTVKVTIKGSQ